MAFLVTWTDRTGRVEREVTTPEDALRLLLLLPAAGAENLAVSDGVDDDLSYDDLVLLLPKANN